MRSSLTMFARWGGLSAALLLGVALLLWNPIVTAAAPTCTVVSRTLNLRTGPGVNYNPPLRTLTRGAVLTPLARNAIQPPTMHAIPMRWTSTRTLVRISMPSTLGQQPERTAQARRVA